MNGGFNVKLVEIDNRENTSYYLKVFENLIIMEKQKVLYTPNGYVNGFKA